MQFLNIRKWFLQKRLSNGREFDVAEDGRAALPVDGVCRGDKRERRGDDLARDAQRLHPHLQGNHAIREERDVFYA